MPEFPSDLPKATAVSSRRHGPWSAGAVQTLTRLWREGDLSASQIARRLGVSRNAVLGKAHRLGLSSSRAKPARRPRLGVPRQRRPERRPRPRPGCGVSGGPIRAETFTAPAASLDPALAIGLVARLEDLPRGGCHWPCGDPRAPGFAFCGRPARPGPYCAGHAGVAYRPGGRRSVAALLRLALRTGV